MEEITTPLEKEYVKTLFNSAQSESQLISYARENYIPVLLEDTERLLALLVRCKAPTRILEIGTAVGYSAKLMLENAPESTIIDTIDIDENRIKIARETLINFSARVNIIVGDALKVLPTLSYKYDFIFLDGPKAQYIRYLPYLTELLSKGGMLFADNVMMHGMVGGGVKFKHRKKYMVTKMRQFLNKLVSEKSLQTTVLSVGDGVSLSVKK